MGWMENKSIPAQAKSMGYKRIGKLLRGKMTDKAARARELADAVIKFGSLYGTKPRSFNLERFDAKNKHLIEQALRAYDGGWRTMESAPKDGTPIILTCNTSSEWTQIAYWDDEAPNPPWNWGRDDSDSHWHAEMFTHWRPIPAPPDTRQDVTLVQVSRKPEE